MDQNKHHDRNTALMTVEEILFEYAELYAENSEQMTPAQIARRGILRYRISEVLMVDEQTFNAAMVPVFQTACDVVESKATGNPSRSLQARGRLKRQINRVLINCFTYLQPVT